MPLDIPRWGIRAKRWMREAFARTLHITGPVQEIPNPHGRVTVDRQVRDKWGIPVVRLSGTGHEQTIVTAEFIRARAQDWLQASGAQRVWSSAPILGLSGGQHQAGTCRMGNDPKTSVTDKWGRVHGIENLFCADGSLHVTNGEFNPVLTILALAFRCGEYVAGMI
jgi:choline dehydrogenase-like flavoprotein